MYVAEEDYPPRLMQLPIKIPQFQREKKVIMVIAKNKDIYVSASFRHGCGECITKPIDEQELLSKVRSLGILESPYKIQAPESTVSV